jgi:hypothetical protein
MIDGFIDGSVNLLVRDISDLIRAPGQERFEFLGDGCTIPGRWNLLRGNSDDADFLVSVNRPAQELLDCGLHALRQLAGLLNRDILHGVNLLPPIVPSWPGDYTKDRIKWQKDLTVDEVLDSIKRRRHLNRECAHPGYQIRLALPVIRCTNRNSGINPLESGGTHTQARDTTADAVPVPALHRQLH